jgi:hypothetical protein
MNWYDWLAQLFGTLIGTGVGFGLAMWWDRKKERDREIHDRTDTTKSILLELQGILGRLETPKSEVTEVESRPGAVAVDMSIPFLSTSAFDAAIHSGKLTLLRPDLQEELSTIYEQVRLMRIHVDNASASYTHGDTAEEHSAVITNAFQYMRAYGELLTDQIQTTCGHLEQSFRKPNAT